jgi:predicted nucleic acid-binding protein
VTAKVADASVVVALLFNEVTRDAVVGWLRDSTLYAPVLLEFEVANACLKKIRVTPDEGPMLLEAFALLPQLSIELRQVDPGEAIRLAHRMKLSLYDASYLWLARAIGAELLTLDEKLARANAALDRPA